MLRYLMLASLLAIPALAAAQTLVHGATSFTDYFVLLKINNEWKIANKVYTRRPTK